MEEYIEKICDEENIPKRFTASENSLYIEKYRNGDKDAMKELISGNLRLVYHIIYSKYTDEEIEDEDLISMGAVFLINAIDQYNSNNSSYFSCYINNYISKKMVSFTKESKRRQESSENIKTLNSINESYDYVMERILIQDEHNSVKKILEELSPRERYIVSKCCNGYWGDAVVSNIAEEFELSESRISQIKRDAYRKIKASLQSKELF